MPLSDIAIRAAKPGPKPIKLSDERGLFLLVQPSGGKLWRLKYRVAGKVKKLSLGCYPDVPLKEARERAGEARELLAARTDPSEKKRVDRLDATLKAAITFKAVADEYIAKSEREGRAAVLAKRFLQTLEERSAFFERSRETAGCSPVCSTGVRAGRCCGASTASTKY